MEQRLLKKLEKLRTEMNVLAINKGLNHPDVLHLSQQIDEIHNKINQLDNNQRHLSGRQMIRESPMYYRIINRAQANKTGLLTIKAASGS
jgi:hypothetical protein